MKTKKNSSLWLQIIVFLIGIVIVDQAILLTGNKLIWSPYWYDPVISNIAKNPPRDVYVVGACRASLYFDSQILSHKTGKSFYNLGRVVDGIGNMDFSLNMVLSYAKPKTVILVLDEELIREDQNSAFDAIKHRMIWWSALAPQYQNELKNRYQAFPFLLKSGLWKFKGQGIELVKASVRSLRKQPIVKHDAYDPYPPLADSFVQKAGEEELKKVIINKLSPHSFALSLIEDFILRIKKNGAKPIIVLPPFHRLYATEEVHKEFILLSQNLAKKHQLEFYNYLNNNNSFSNTDHFWTNTSHMNRTGAETFSAQVGEEIKRALN